MAINFTAEDPFDKKLIFNLRASWINEFDRVEREEQ